MRITIVTLMMAIFLMPSAYAGCDMKHDLRHIDIYVYNLTKTSTSKGYDLLLDMGNPSEGIVLGGGVSHPGWKVTGTGCSNGGLKGFQSHISVYRMSDHQKLAGFFAYMPYSVRAQGQAYITFTLDKPLCKATIHEGYWQYKGGVMRRWVYSKQIDLEPGTSYLSEADRDEVIQLFCKSPP